MDTGMHDNCPKNIVLLYGFIVQLTNLLSHLCNENFYQMKRLLVLLFSIPFITLAQISHLVVEGSSPALYLMHTVQAKENYYSIGRLYNVSPKEIAPFNNLQLEKGLSLHQIIKVPLTANNFLQSGNAAADEVLVPVHHILLQKEGLYRVGVTYNKLSLENLKKWNNIKGESVPRSSGNRQTKGTCFYRRYSCKRACGSYLKKS